MARCSVTFNANCSWTKQAGKVVFTATTHVYFGVIGDGDNSQDGDTYLASISFQRTPTNSISTGFSTYTIGESNDISDSYVYVDHGDHPAGYSVEFGPGSGSCENQIYSNNFVVRNHEEGGCELIDEGLSAAPIDAVPVKSPTKDPTEQEESSSSVNALNVSPVSRQNNICAQTVYKAQETCSFAPTCNENNGVGCPKDTYCFPSIICDSARIVRQNICAPTLQEFDESCNSNPTCNSGEVCPAGTFCFPNVVCFPEEEEKESSGLFNNDQLSPSTTLALYNESMISSNNPPNANVISSPFAAPAVDSPPVPLLQSETSSSAFSENASVPAVSVPTKAPTSPISSELSVAPSDNNDGSSTAPAISEPPNTFAPTLLSGESQPIMEDPMLHFPTHAPSQRNSPDTIPSAGMLACNNTGSLLVISLLMMCHYILRA